MAALITVPIGLVCYALMMFGYEEKYGRTVKATKELNAVTAEYIRGIDVHFAYGDTEILHGVSMTVHKGEFIALVGPSGSGKSTIARLIASLWDVSGGSISLGGVNIKEIPLDDYNDRIAYVSQDNYMFDLTIRENIRLGRQTATDAEVEEAAKQCGSHDFIMGLESGYDTVVGFSGGHLSGGERQRIAIARAMLKSFFDFCSPTDRKKFYASIVLSLFQAIFEALKIPAIACMVSALLENKVTAQTCFICLGIMAVSVIGSCARDCSQRQ